MISTSTNQHYISHTQTFTQQICMVAYTKNFIRSSCINHPTIWLNSLMTDQFPCQYRDISSTPSLLNCFYLLFVSLLIFTYFMGTMKNSNLLYSHIVKSWMILLTNILILIPWSQACLICVHILHVTCIDDVATQQTRNIASMLDQCWASVVQCGPTLSSIWLMPYVCWVD